MPDIREILAALDVDDRALWSEHRTTMRRSYLNAHNETVGMGQWSHEDDAFMDLIDIRLALLFDRSGRLNSARDIIGNGDKIADDLKAAEDKMKWDKNNSIEKANKSIKEALAGTNINDKVSSTYASDASKMLKEGWK